jgi:uncharacterized protein (UPF0218 family)
VPEVVLRLQAALRGELKEPMGELYTDAEALLSAAGEPVIAVGDVVTYHLLEAGHTPAVALVDERTERSAVDPEISAGIDGFDSVVAVENPAATLTAELLQALVTAVTTGAETTLIEVDGEEDLAALPAIVLAPDGASVVYGQPGEGMVLVTVDRSSTDRVRDLLSRMEGDTERFRALLAADQET